MIANNFVIDSNVLISAFVFNSKNPSEVLMRCLKKGKMVVSDEVLEEYKAKVLSEKFEPIIPLAKREHSLTLFIRVCEKVLISEKITDCRDTDDNKFLELAVAANAACIVTGDKDLLTLNPFRNILILTPADFLNLY